VDQIVEIFLLAVMLGWLGIAVASCLSAFACQFDPPPTKIVHSLSAAVIIPIRGIPPHFEALWRGLCAQSYQLFRVIFAVESELDPAYAAVRSRTKGPPVDIVVAGPARRAGQKVHNLLAALRTLKKTDAVVVLAGADIVPARDWLARLMQAFDDHVNDIVCAYRWMMPIDERWSTAFVCVVNSSIVTAIRLLPINYAWGGSTALRRHTLDALELDKCWARAVVDDVVFSRLVRNRRIRIYGPRDALVPTPVSYSWQQAIALGRRQYLLVRMHAPLLWVAAAVLTTLPLVGWAAAIPLAVGGSKLAIGVIGGVVALDFARARFRARVPEKLWRISIPRHIQLLDRWATPLWLAFHAGIIWSTLFGRSITWAGRRYWVDSQRRVDRIVRLPAAATAESSAEAPSAKAPQTEADAPRR
jgi:hypothetical protein